MFFIITGIDLKLYGQLVDFLSEVKYLGVVIDNNVKFNKHDIVDKIS